VSHEAWNIARRPFGPMRALLIVDRLRFRFQPALKREGIVVALPAGYLPHFQRAANQLRQEGKSLTGLTVCSTVRLRCLAVAYRVLDVLDGLTVLEPNFHVHMGPGKMVYRGRYSRVDR